MSFSVKLILALSIFATTGLSRNLNINRGDEPLFNKGLFQGDITGIDPYDFNDRSSIVNLRRLWPNATVYYELTEDTEDIRDVIEDALKEYHTKTCLRFVEKLPSDNTIKDFIRVDWEDGCWSAVGKSGGMQSMSLGDGCEYRGIIVHEFGHAIGLFHEHSRSDRDDFVQIIWDNVMKGEEIQFQKMSFWENNLLGEQFDYKSIMLYDEMSFSKDGESITMKVKTPGVVIGPVWEKPGLSEVDVRKINKLYQCFGQVRPDPKFAPDFECDFEQHNCGFEERTDKQGFTRRVRHLGNRTSTVLVAEASELDSTYVRIPSPRYMMINRDAGCFSFDYYMDGKDVFDVGVLKTDKEITHILYDKKVSSFWKTFSFDVPRGEEEPRFTFTAFFKRRGTLAQGVVALDNIAFKYQKCQ